jgi:hypothetical protein
MTRQRTEAKEDQTPEDEPRRRFLDLARNLTAVPNAEVQAALAEEKRAKAERKRPAATR